MTLPVSGRIITWPPPDADPTDNYSVPSWGEVVSTINEYFDAPDGTDIAAPQAAMELYITGAGPRPNYSYYLPQPEPGPTPTPRPPVPPNPVPISIVQPNPIQSFPDCDTMSYDERSTRSDDPGVDGPTFGIKLGSYVLRDKCIEGIISIGGVSTERDYYVSMEAQTGVGFYNDCAVDTLGSRRPRHVLHRPAKPQSGLNPVLPAAQGWATVEKPAPLRSSYRRSSNFAI